MLTAYTDAYNVNTCKRTDPAMDMEPDCFSTTVCQNGGTAVYESNICWCECTVDWQGDFDCSKPTMAVGDLPPGSDICKFVSGYAAFILGGNLKLAYLDLLRKTG